MKNSKEIAETVFQRRDAYLNRQKERNRKIRKAVPIGSTFCIFIIVMIGANNLIDKSRLPSIIEQIPDTISESETTEKILISPENRENLNEVDTKKQSDSEPDLDEVQRLDDSTDATVIVATAPTEPEPVEETTISSVTTTENPEELPFTEQIEINIGIPEEPIIVESTVIIPEEPTITEVITVTTDAPEEQTTTEDEIVPEPNWDEKTLTQQFPEFSWNDDMYGLRNTEILPEYVGSEVADISLSGYDIYTDTQYSTSAYIHRIADISEKCAVAIRFRNYDNYYIYINNDYFPVTLGELIENLDLENTISFSHVYLKYDLSSLSEQFNQSEVISFLMENRDCQYISEEFPYRKLITFGVNIELLGIYNKFITISDNGYLITNILEWQYNFYIGEEKANQFCEMFEEIPKISDNISSSFPEDDIVLE